MTNKQIIERISLNDYMILLQTVSGEAENQSQDGRIGVVNTVLNRVEKKTYFGHNVTDVCLQNADNGISYDEAFSCWGEGSKNRERILSLGWDYMERWGIISDVKLALYHWMGGQDIVLGATHYHTKGCHPFWAKGHTPCKVIGDHMWYNTVR